MLSVIVAMTACPSESSEPAGLDTDGDGLSDAEETTLHGTSPVLSDTDGDGWSDRDEIVGYAFDPVNAPYRFNPRVADFPRVGVVLTSAPLVVIEVTEANGITHTFETGRSETIGAADSRSVTHGNGRSDTLQTTHGVSVDLGVSDTLTLAAGQASERSVSGTVDVDAGRGGAGGTSGPVGGAGGVGGTPIDVDGAGGRAGAPEAPGGGDSTLGSITIGAASSESAEQSISTTRSRNTSQSFEYSPSTTDEVSFSSTQEESIENARTLSEAESLAESSEGTAISGILKTTLVVENRGNLPVVVANLFLSATLEDARGAVVPVGNLVIDQPSFNQWEPFSVAPGAVVGPINFSRAALALATARELLLDARPLVIRVGGFLFENAEGVPFDLIATEIRTKTATTAIDYGGRRSPELHLVATNLDPARSGVTAGRVLEDILRIPFQATNETGLTAVRDVEANASGLGRWYVELRKGTPGGVVATPYDALARPYDFGAIELHAGDALILAWVGP